MVDRFKFASAWNGGSRFAEGETYIRASDYDALARDLAACKIARDGFTAASDTAQARERELEAALLAAKRLFDEALPKFNWGRSALDANAIRLLNEVPPLVDVVLAGPSPSDATVDRGDEPK